MGSNRRGCGVRSTTSVQDANDKSSAAQRSLLKALEVFAVVAGVVSLFLLNPRFSCASHCLNEFIGEGAIGMNQCSRLTGMWASTSLREADENITPGRNEGTPSLQDAWVSPTVQH